MHKLILLHRCIEIRVQHNIKKNYWPFTKNPDKCGCATELRDTWRSLDTTKICFSDYLRF